MLVLDTSPFATAISSATVTPKPIELPKFFRSSARPRAVLAKVKIGADDHMPQTQAVDDDLAGKPLWREAGQDGVERQLIEPLDAEFAQPVGAGFGVHQAKRRAIRGEELAGVRFEGQDAKRGVQALRLGFARCR